MGAPLLRDEPVAQAMGQNALLAALPAEERSVLARRLARVELAAEQVLAEPGEPVSHLVFPLTCVVALGLVQDGHGIDLAPVGRDGVVGLGAWAGVERDPQRAVCRVPGLALLLDAGEAELPQLAFVLHRHSQAQTTLLLQRLLCARLHGGDERCATWLLQTYDRVGRTSFALTHAVLAGMLGVRRATVSAIAAGLQRAGLIRYNRGRMWILDPRGLEARTCPCYPAVRRFSGSALAT